MAKRVREKPLWKRIASVLVYGLFCLVFLVGGATAGWISQSKLLKATLLAKIGIAPPKPEEVFNRDSITLLVLGCDEDRVYGRTKPIREKARSDMMLVAKVDFKRKRISGVSIPRDTLVAAAGYGEQKINAYHALGMQNGGEERAKDLAKDAAQTLLGVGIDKVVVVDYKALQEMVNLVGGVEIFVKKKMEYHDNAGKLHIDLDPGRHRLNGYQAMGFVRFRHDRGSDFARQERQKEFLLAFKKSLQENLGMLPQVINKAVEAMSGGLKEDEVNSLAMFAQQIGGDNVQLGQIPVVDAPNYNLRVDHAQLSKVLAQYHLIDAQTPTQVSYRR
jgi:polyisoprenyl-teichoic acid--peptidoglycan teichoic acid transferase